MSRDIKYIGMDVHKEAIVIAVLNSNGKLVMESIVETKASSILQFIHGLQGELHVTWEMASSDHAKDVLQIIRSAFACPDRCVKVSDDRRPRMTLLLLEHLNEITGGNMRTDIEEVKQSVLQQARTAN